MSTKVKHASFAPHRKYGGTHRRNCRCYTCRIWRMHYSTANLMERVKHW